MNPAATRPGLPASSDAAPSSGDAALASLLQASAGGDGSAFESFYDRTVAQAETVARALLGGDDVDELLCDAYFEAWRQAARFDAARGGALGWLLAIVRSRAIDRMRRQPAPSDDGSGRAAANAADPIDALWRQQGNARLSDALAGLDATERWALGLAYFRACSQHEIAQHTGMAPASVESVLARAQAKLRQALGTAALAP